MSVNTNGHTIYAHKSLSLNEIVHIIQHSEGLISKFVYLRPSDIADTEPLLAKFGERGTFVRTRGINANKEYARLHTTVVCECGCKIHRGLIYKHSKTKKHARLMAERA